MENYIKGELLGMGTYGKVIKVVHKEVSENGCHTTKSIRYTLRRSYREIYVHP